MHPTTRLVDNANVVFDLTLIDDALVDSVVDGDGDDDAGDDVEDQCYSRRNASADSFCCQ